MRPGNCGKPGSDEDDGQAALCRAVQRGDQRGELVLLDILQLVDEDRRARYRPVSRRLPLTSSSACRSCSRSPLSARPGSGSKSSADFDVLVFDLERLCEAGQSRAARAERDSLALALRDSRNRARRNCGASMAGKERSSGASTRDGVNAARPRHRRACDRAELSCRPPAARPSECSWSDARRAPAPARCG